MLFFGCFTACTVLHALCIKDARFFFLDLMIPLYQTVISILSHNNNIPSSKDTESQVKYRQLALLAVDGLLWWWWDDNNVFDFFMRCYCTALWLFYLMTFRIIRCVGVAAAKNKNDIYLLYDMIIRVDEQKLFINFTTKFQQQ